MRLERVFRVTLFFAAACSTPAFAATHVIDVGPGGSFSFSPATITIPPGDTITFQSNAGIAHNAVSDDGTTFNSGPAVAGRGAGTAESSAPTLMHDAQPGAGNRSHWAIYLTRSSTMTMNTPEHQDWKGSWKKP